MTANGHAADIRRDPLDAGLVQVVGKPRKVGHPLAGLLGRKPADIVLLRVRLAHAVGLVLAAEGLNRAPVVRERNVLPQMKQRRRGLANPLNVAGRPNMVRAVIEDVGERGLGELGRRLAAKRNRLQQQQDRRELKGSHYRSLRRNPG